MNMKKKYFALGLLLLTALAVVLIVGGSKPPVGPIDDFDQRVKSVKESTVPGSSDIYYQIGVELKEGLWNVVIRIEEDTVGFTASPEYGSKIYEGSYAKPDAALYASNEAMALAIAEKGMNELGSLQNSNRLGNLGIFARIRDLFR